MCFPGGWGWCSLPLCEVITVTLRYRVSYMNVYALLYFLNELGKRDKMLGLPSILSPFHNEFNELKMCMHEC